MIQSNKAYIPGGDDPHASHRMGDFIPAVNISLAETIFTLTGFTVCVRVRVCLSTINRVSDNEVRPKIQKKTKSEKKNKKMVHVKNHLETFLCIG